MPWKNEPELNPSEHAQDTDSDHPKETIKLDHDRHDPGSIHASGTSLNSTLEELVKEFKRRRRWGLVSKLVIWLIIAGIIGAVFTGQHRQITGEHTALVRLEGFIADGYDASAENVLSGLKNAFEAKDAKGVILAINSPGGSPVQADMLYQEIKRLKQKHNKPLVAVISDLGASGGYYAAVAAEKIYANPSSIVGSIGVLMNGFGFVDLMDKVGVERRLLTAGENKGALDPFSPLNEAEMDHAKQVIGGVHQQFIDVVRESRGARLKENDELFSGQFWNGQQAHELGLTDGLKNHWAVAREDIGQETIVDYSMKPDVLERFGQTLGASIARHFKLYLSESIPNLK